MLIVGEKEQQNQEVSVRKQGEGDKGSINLTIFANNLNKEVYDMMNHWRNEVNKDLNK